MNVLIVDDVASNRKLVRANLEAEGFQTFQASDGVEALEILEREKIDIIISDILMPRMDGYRLCHEIRHHERFSGIPIIFHTSTYTSPSDEKVALEFGGDKFLRKPTPAKELLAAVREVTSKPAAPRASFALPGKELELVKKYSQQLVSKLEHKNEELTQLTEELREQARALKETEALYESLVETSPVNVFRKDLQGRFTFANRRFCKLHGRTLDEIVGKTDHDINPKELADKYRADDRRVIETGEVLEDIEEHRQRADGNKKGYFHVLKAPVFDSEGRIAGTQGILWDVTERKRAAEMLLESEEKYRLLLEQIPDVVWRADSTGNPIFMTANIEQTLGYTPQEIYAAGQKLWFGRIHPDDRAKVRAAFDELIERNKSYDVEYRIQKKDGNWIWVHDRAMYRNEKRGIRYADGLFTDVTERRHLEEHLRQGQKLEAIGQLAGGVAHDFNNILTVIQGYTQLLLNREKLSGEGTERLNEVALAAERAANLTRQLLTFSRRHVIQRAVLDLNEVVGNVTKMLRRIIGEDIALQNNYGPGLPPLEADAGLIEQVLLNLAVNARDAMPHGGQLVITTSVETIDSAAAQSHPEARAGEFICLTMSDTGCGIEPEVLPHIFEPFFTTKDVGKGTGLGLATVYGIVQQHHGWIAVSTEPGSGTIFKIYLPRTSPVAAPAVAAPAAPRALAGTETILLVEDEPALRTLARTILEMHGYRVLDAASGVDALGVWQERSGEIDLLLTDMVMPDGMNGRELAQELQARKPSLVVVYSSGYAVNLADQDLLLKEGLNFLPKPYQPHDLANAVRAALDSRPR
jgi:PAS domain S-box-containing protein